MEVGWRNRSLLVETSGEKKHTTGRPKVNSVIINYFID